VRRSGGIAAHLPLTRALARGEIPPLGSRERLPPVEEDPMSETAGTKPQKMVFDVQGMTCGNCSGKVQKVLTGLEGVTYALVSHERNEAIVRFAPDKVTADALKEAIRSAGYAASVRQ
jgi:Cu+-exporting ATPase